ncbi:MAG: L-aspartate oxidase [Synechococcales bacterium]|nr:L-aspartate oxidase [Synechococcales bacterium]
MLTSQFDVLVIGAGAAGLYAALCLPDHLQVGLITKETLSRSASDWAQGGIAAAIAPDDSPQLHVEDTLKAGAGLCDRDAVELVARRASDCIHSLVDMGVAFDRHGGQLALTLEAAHSRHRVLHAADTTGRAIVNQLIAQVLQRKNITPIEQALVLDLWLTSDRQRCRGVCLLHGQAVQWLATQAVILATGGGGQVYAQTTNPAVSTGDGVAIAWRAGAILRDLEFVQFHPTALTVADAPRFLISEAVRGEGAHLVDGQGRRFAFDYHPAGELAPRDVVSRAIYHHLQDHPTDDPTPHVWLDLRPISAERVRHRFPNIIQVCQDWGIDVFQSPIPVAPAAHYWMGGIATDLQSRTSITGLYAVGETANTGVHGANRLASNSLLECLVFGSQLAQLEWPLREASAPGIAPSPSPPGATGQSWAANQPQFALIHHLRQEIPRLMWRSAGISRHQAALEEAIAQLTEWRTDFTRLPLTQSLSALTPDGGEGVIPVEPPDSPDSMHGAIRIWSETRNLLDIAFLILKSAAFRQESRGGHFRSDFPAAEPHWQVHTLVQHGKIFTSKPVG